MLYDLYKNYYSDPAHENLDNLLHEIFNYNFEEDFQELCDNLVELPRNHKVEFGTLTTNTQNFYNFGPHLSKLLDRIETYLRWGGQPKTPSLQIQTGFHRNVVTKSNLGIKNIRDNVALIKDHMQPNTNVFALPHILNELMQYDLPPVFGYTNFDSPCLVKKKDVYLNDQMISWKTGLNFYTCRSGNHHFLPIFVKNGNRYLNLLNLHQIEQKIDDGFDLKNFFNCSCGRKAANFDFKPHLNNLPDFYDLGVINHLETNLEWLQFIQKIDQFFVYHQPELSERDQEFLKSKMNVVFKPGESFKIGRKLPAFWKINSFEI